MQAGLKGNLRGMVQMLYPSEYVDAGEDANVLLARCAAGLLGELFAKVGGVDVFQSLELMKEMRFVPAGLAWGGGGGAVGGGRDDGDGKDDGMDEVSRRFQRAPEKKMHTPGCVPT